MNLQKKIKKIWELEMSSFYLIFGSFTFGTLYFYLSRYYYDLSSQSYILISIYTGLLLFIISNFNDGKNFERDFIFSLFFHFSLFYISKFFNNNIFSIITPSFLIFILFKTKKVNLFKENIKNNQIKLISFLLGSFGSFYVIYTQTFRNMVTSLNEVQLLNGTIHHDSLYRSAIANLFYTTGSPSVGINNLNTIKTHFFSELYLSVFSNTIHPGESVLFNIYFFQIIFIPSLIFLLISNKRKAGSLIYFYIILICLTLVNSYWGTKSFNNLPFEVSVIFFVMGFDYLNKINKQKKISFGNLFLLSVILNITFLSKVLTGLALALILLINLNFKKIKYQHLVYIIFLTSFPAVNLFLTTLEYPSTLDIWKAQYKTTTTFILLFLVLLNIKELNKRLLATLFLLFTSSVIFSYYINSWNQSFFLEFMVFIYIVLTSTNFKSSKNSLLLLIFLIFNLTFLNDNLKTIDENLTNFITKDVSNINYESEFQNLKKDFADFEKFQTVILRENSFVWDNGYSCQYPFLITQALTSRQVEVYPPKEFIDCKGYGINETPFG